MTLKSRVNKLEGNSPVLTAPDCTGLKDVALFEAINVFTQTALKAGHKQAVIDRALRARGCPTVAEAGQALMSSASTADLKLIAADGEGAQAAWERVVEGFKLGPVA